MKTIHKILVGTVLFLILPAVSLATTIPATSSLLTGTRVAGLFPNGTPLDQATYNGLCAAKGYPGTTGTFVSASANGPSQFALMVTCDSVTYSCPNGYTLSGTNCIQNVGTVSVSSNISSSWKITGNIPTPIIDSGISQSYVSQPAEPTTYTITWGDVAGYTTPPTQSLTLGPLGTITFNGNYVENCGTVIDADGNTYGTVVIGTQCWMNENLRTSKKPDGTNLIEGSGMYSNPAGSGSPWGKLYDWNTAMNGSPAATATGAEIQGICPAGWHIPSDYNASASDDWQKLSNFLGGDTVSGGKMKRTEAIYWEFPNTGATNQSGFAGVAAGAATLGEEFPYRGQSADFFSSSESSFDGAWGRGLSYASTGSRRRQLTNSVGFPVRCIQNSLPPPVYSCTSLPANATPFSAPDDNTGLTVDTPYTYSTSNTATKCQFNGCTAGYTWSGGSCAQDVNVTIFPGDSPILTGTGTTLFWSTSPLTPCNASGRWSGTRGSSGTESTGNLSPAGIYSYLLECGTGFRTATVVVNDPIAPVSPVKTRFWQF